MRIDSHPPPEPADRSDLPAEPDRPAAENHQWRTDTERLLRIDSETAADQVISDAPDTDSARLVDVDPAPDRSSAAPVTGDRSEDPAGDPDHAPIVTSGESVSAATNSIESPAPPDTAATVERTEVTDAAERRDLVTDAVATHYGVDSDEGRAAIGKAYDTVREHLAPLIVHATASILEDCKQIAAERPDTRVVFLGRDAHTMALAARELDPEFFEEHCTEMTISRSLADAVVQDVEAHSDKTFDELETSFRTARDGVDPDAVPGARAQMTQYMELRGVPVGTPGTPIVFVDTSFRGTVQELIQAAYPNTRCEGHYLIFGEAERDPHPHTKTGHLLHQSADGTVVSHDPAVPAELAPQLSDKDTVLAIEQTLRGPWSKAERFGSGAIPEQHLESPPLDQIAPPRVAPEYQGATVRLAVMDANQHAVADCARDYAGRAEAGQDIGGELAAKTEAGLRQVRSWATRSSGTDTELAGLLDSFVRRSDKHIVAQLHAALGDRTDTAKVWHEFEQLGSMDEKQAFANAQDHTTESTGDEHG
ncbi:hypothetical protein [Nocardia terpenica]|uniref:Uncharacterized protein n=1 Tax=Nocardia terpenica TaxID=455432 RepID=A0A291RHB0_9NOCA|nr:hypothetical protein [Nocardia terpenica]ATL66688.1 hypothetical protein CRH09_11180 [Nocardia terpenica]